MNLENIAIELRPRSHWESMDLGFKLAKSQFKPLLILWCLLALPTYAILKFSPISGIFTLLIWWWLKPVYEVALHFWLSRSVFNEKVSYRQCYKPLKQRFFILLKTYVLFWRLGGSRSQNMSIAVIESSTGKAWKNRIQVFSRVNSQAGWLTTLCLHFEAALAYSLLLLCAIFLPTENLLQYVFTASTTENIWLPVITELCFILAAGLVAPFYVGAGFMLYINRRTNLEAWDIDVDFKRICNRFDKKQETLDHKSTSQSGHNQPGGIAAAFALFFITLVNTPSADAIDLPDKQESREIIQDVLSDREFGEIKTAKRLKYIGKDKKKSPSTKQNWFFGFKVADSLRALLWCVVIVISIIFLGYLVRRKDKLAGIFSLRGFKKKKAKSQAFDLDISPESLPRDIPAQARKLVLQGKQRQAMGLLYRGALSRLVHLHGMYINDSATEQECLIQVGIDQPENRKNTFQLLTNIWLKSAYTRLTIPNEDITSLCDQWSQAFDSTEVKS